MKWSDIDLKGRTSGQTKTICPDCSHTRKNKNEKCLSVNIDEMLWDCHNCGSKGTGKAFEKPKREYTVPDFNNTELSDKTLNWFLGRKISKSTILRFKITESVEYVPQVEEKRNCINFNYFRNNALVNVKFRDARKNFKMVSGAELIFYNLDCLEGSETVVICEGEIDALSFYESGIFNVVSVPNGASKGNQKLEYLDNCWKEFEHVKKIIIATDNDEPGKNLKEELARRFGKERCWFISYPEACKDANDVLVNLGPVELKKIVSEASMWPLEGIKTVYDFRDRIAHIYENGYPKGCGVNFGEFDKLLTFMPGQLTVITGIPGSGKSEFTDQLLINLSKFHDWKWGVFSAENQPEEYHFIKLAEKLQGMSFYSSNEIYKMPEPFVLDSANFINENFYFVNIDDNNITLDGLLDKCKELVLRKGINGFLIDPWNYVEHKIPAGYTETQYISEALTKVCRCAKMNNIHMIMIAHPVKIQKEDGKYKVATLYDIAGSAHWFNKTDNGLSVYRDFETGIVDVHVQKVRFKWLGTVGKASFTWDKFTGRYTEHLNVPEHVF